MTLKNSINFFERLKTETTKKSENKLYHQFIDILTKLENRDFSAKEIQLIEMELDSIHLESNPENRKKFFRKALNKFENYLKDEFSLTSKGYYTNLSVGLGMVFGVVIGVLIGERFEKSLGISFGICIGIFLGAFIGRLMDAQAESAGNTL